MFHASKESLALAPVELPGPRIVRTLNLFVEDSNDLLDCCTVLCKRLLTVTCPLLVESLLCFKQGLPPLR